MNLMKPMEKQFTKDAWEDIEYWLKEDRKILLKIHFLLKDIERSAFSGIGKPEALKHELSGYWSRRIDEENRLVYTVQDNKIVVIQCKTHYKK